jgi:hypothetical protein
MVIADRRSTTARERSGPDAGREVEVALDADLDAVRDFILTRLTQDAVSGG